MSGYAEFVEQIHFVRHYLMNGKTDEGYDLGDVIDAFDNIASSFEWTLLEVEKLNKENMQVEDELGAVAYHVEHLQEGMARIRDWRDFRHTGEVRDFAASFLSNPATEGVADGLHGERGASRNPSDYLVEQDNANPAMSHAGVHPGDRSPIGLEAPGDDAGEPRGSNQESKP